MAYTSGKKMRRDARKSRYVTVHTRWWHLLNVLRWLNLKRLAYAIYTTPRPVTAIYRDGKLFEVLHHRSKPIIAARVRTSEPGAKLKEEARQAQIASQGLAMTREGKPDQQ